MVEAALTRKEINYYLSAIKSQPLRIRGERFPMENKMRRLARKYKYNYAAYSAAVQKLWDKLR